jgi:SAM-dependent methyltransferase
VKSTDSSVATKVRALGELPTGAATMSPGMRSANRYARYLYDCVKPWLAAPVLEIGSGFGTYTELLLGHGRVIAADIDESCLAVLAERLGDRDITTIRIDLNDHDLVRSARKYGIRSAFSTNVFEHIEDDIGAFAALLEALEPGGHLCVVVPAHASLYGYMDERAGHFRRYTRTGLAAALRRSGWSVCKSFYINSIGGLGWWLNHKLLPPQPLDAPRINNQLVFYDRFVVPFARVTDLLTSRFFGLSVVAIARKPGQLAGSK